MVTKGKRFRVLSVDQFDGNNYLTLIKTLNFKTWEAARHKSKLPLQLVMGSKTIIVTSDDQHPMKGKMWFRSVKGKFRLYKSNYDSSGN